MGRQRGRREHLPCGELIWGFHLSSRCLLQSWGDLGVMAQNKRVISRREAKRHWPQGFSPSQEEGALGAGLRRDAFRGDMGSEELGRYSPVFPNPHSHMILAIFGYSLYYFF